MKVTSILIFHGSASSSIRGEVNELINIINDIKIIYFLYKLPLQFVTRAK